MIKLLIPFCLCALANIAMAQNSNPYPTTGNLGLSTASPTHTLTLGAVSTGLAFYNTVDQTANIERLRQFWANDTFNIAMETSGTGNIRNLALGSGPTVLVLSSINAVNGVNTAMMIDRTATGVGKLLTIGGSFNTSSGMQNTLTIASTISQSGTGGYRSLWISPYEQSLGSGSRLLIDAGTNNASYAGGFHNSVFNVNANGIMSLGARMGIGAIGTTPVAQLQIMGMNATGTAFGTQGFGLQIGNNTYNSSSAGGLTPYQATHSIGVPTLTATNASTLNNASTFYIAGPPIAGSNVSITNPIALMVANGNSSFDGRIGVGTTTPAATLDVGKLLNQGEMSVVLARLTEGNTMGNGTYLGVRGYDTQPAVGSDITKVKSFAIEHSFYGSTNNSINFFRGGGFTGGSISLNTDQNIERMRILGNGNVGIGTESPDQKLTVNGTIHSSAVKVDTSIPVPDYVFEPGYQLSNLNETKAYVSKFHHLPEVPSGKEMEKEGIDLGKMNLLLLKKVEELTLHLIKQDKRIARLEAEKHKPSNSTHPNKLRLHAVAR